MGRDENAWNQGLNDRSSGRFDFAAVAGDRASDLLAARARWETARPRTAVAGPAPRPGPVRLRLGTQLVRLGTRLQGLSSDVAPRSARTTEVGAR